MMISLDSGGHYWGQIGNCCKKLTYMPLTDIAIRRAKRSDKARNMFDEGDLYFEVAHSGRKRWH